MRDRLTSLLNVERAEVPVVVTGFLMFVLLFAGYFMLRPVRETMGITGGVDNLPWLFTATFVATLVALPLFGWVAATVPRRWILAVTYGFFVANLVGFAMLFLRAPDDAWTARVFYVWLSVFNLLAISLAWSVLADLMYAPQARRIFAIIAAGASTGALTGPALGGLLVAPIGHAGLLALSAAMLAISAGLAELLHRWRDAHPMEQDRATSRHLPLGGNAFAGATAVLHSRYLAIIAVFVVLLAVVSTFLYVEQARLVAATFPDKTQQTQVFSAIDIIVQTLTLLLQVFVTGRLAERYGIAVLLTAVPLIMAAGFLWLAFAPVFAVLAIVMVVRRVGEYALVRPGREMLYTVVAPEEKYKAKNFIDTVVYRGGDAIGAWVKRGLDVMAEHPAAAMVIGVVIALSWGALGALLGRRQQAREQAVAASA